MNTPNMALLEHVRSKCTEDPNTGCWIWSLSLSSAKYANQSRWPRSLGGDGRTLNAHALAYAALKGPVPDGLELDHLCRRRDCANPYHCEPVTSSVNKQRRRSGEPHPLSEYWFAASPDVESIINTITTTIESEAP